MSKQVRQLKKLRNIEPSQQWEDTRWEFLRSQIQTEETHTLSVWEKAMCVMGHPSLFRTFANTFAVVVVAVIGSWSMIASAEQTTHGDMLYPVKQVLERASIALTVNDSARVEKRTELASTRVRELRSLAIRLEYQEANTQSIDRTVRDLKRELEAAQASFAAVKESGDSEAILAAATKVEQDTDALVKEIEAASDSLPANVELSVSQEIEAAANVAESTNAEALEIMITQGLADNAVAEEDVVAKLQERIVVIENQYAALGVALTDWQAAATQEQAEQLVVVEDLDAGIADNFSKFDALFAEKDYIGVLTHIQTIKQQFIALEAALQPQANEETETDTAEGDETHDAATSTPPQEE